MGPNRHRDEEVSRRKNLDIYITVSFNSQAKSVRIQVSVQRGEPKEKQWRLRSVDNRSVLSKKKVE